MELRLDLSFVMAGDNLVFLTPRLSQYARHLCLKSSFTCKRFFNILIHSSTLPSIITSHELIANKHSSLSLNYSWLLLSPFEVELLFCTYLLSASLTFDNLIVNTYIGVPTTSVFQAHSTISLMPPSLSHEFVNLNGFLTSCTCLNSKVRAQW